MASAIPASHAQVAVIVLQDTTEALAAADLAAAELMIAVAIVKEIQLLQITINYVAHVVEAEQTAIVIVLEIIQTAAEQGGTIQVQAADFAEHSSNIAVDVTGQVLINALIKEFALLDKHNASMTDIKLAVAHVNGKMPVQILMEMPKTFNAVIHYATMCQEFMIQQKQQQKQTAQMEQIMIAMEKQIAQTQLAQDKLALME